MRLGKTTIFYFLSQVALSVAGFLATLYIARALGAAVLGKYALVVALLSWFSIPSAALGSAINKRLSEGGSQSEYLLAGILLNGTVFVVIVSIIFIFADSINAYLNADVHKLLALLIIVTGSFQTLRYVLEGRKRVATAGIVRAIERVLRTGAQIALIILGYELSGIIFGHIGSLFITILISIPILGIRPELPTIEHIKSLLDFARYAWLGTLQNRTFGWMDTIILGFFVAPDLIGIYEVAWSLTSVLALIGLSISHTLFPEISSLSEVGDVDHIRHLLDEGLAFTGLFAIPGLLGAVVIGPRLLRIYRPEFVKGAYILILLIMARLLAVYGHQLKNAINAIDRPDIAFRVNLFFISANLILNIVLVYFIGWTGAAIATLISAGMMLAAAYYSLRQLIDTIAVPYGVIAREFVASFVMAAVLIALQSFVPSSDPLTVVLILVGAGCYSVVLIGISQRVRNKLLTILPSEVAAV